MKIVSPTKVPVSTMTPALHGVRADSVPLASTYYRPLGMLYPAIAVHQTRSGATPDHQRQGQIAMPSAPAR
jgi:hypothetical protein